MINDTGMMPSISNLPFSGEAYTIDHTGPAVELGETSAADGYYKAMASMWIMVNFSEPVSSSGLTIQLNSGAVLTTGPSAM
jgi:hypothetical protein